MTRAWFPRPAVPDDVRTLPPPGRWTALEICELLRAPDAVEWRDRVGVSGTKDGSARASTRLLAVHGWVVKTRVDQVWASADELEAHVLASREIGLQAKLWHPDKQWALLRARDDDGWHAITLTPHLKTLRRIAALPERMHAWVEMARMAARSCVEHAVGLDLNPANFGTRGDPRRLYYIDDETYPAVLERDLAGAVVARIPEEPGVDVDGWRGWARRLLAVLEAEAPRQFDWERFVEEVLAYPVAERFEARKDALFRAFREPVLAAARGRSRRERNDATPRLTCVFADVHANLPALDATLRAADGLGADTFLFLGDAVGYGPHPSECIARLAELEHATLLRGNHDHAIGTGRLDVGMNRVARQCAEWSISVLRPAELQWLSSLEVEHVDGEWMAVHGAPRDPRKFLAYVYELTYEDNLRYLRQQAVPHCFYGHTHVPLVHVEPPSGPVKLHDSRSVDLRPTWPTLVNPGSVGQPRDGDPRAAFALWDRRAQRVSFHRAVYRVSDTLSDLRARDLPAELQMRLVTGV